MKTNVSFPSADLELAGHLYTPDERGDGPVAAVVVGHPFTGVKEQTAGIYAQRLADAGYVALAFDAAYQGESEGQPRGLENPYQRAEDFKAAVSFLGSREEVDPERIGALGICGSGGYVPFAAQSDRRIKAVATVSAVDVTSWVRDGLGRTEDGSAFSALLDKAGEARTAEAEGKPAPTLNALPADEVDASTPGIYGEFFDYYRTPRGQNPRSTQEWVLYSVDQMAPYDSFARIAEISPRPLLMIAGTDAETKYFSEDAVAAAGEPKELFWVEGATHPSLYDRDEHVSQAVAKLTEFFGRHLVAGGVGAEARAAA